MIILRFFLLSPKQANESPFWIGWYKPVVTTLETGRKIWNSRPPYSLHSKTWYEKQTISPPFFYWESIKTHFWTLLFICAWGRGACVDEKTICNRWSLSPPESFPAEPQICCLDNLFWEFKNKRHILKDYRLNMKSSLLAGHSHIFL